MVMVIIFDVADSVNADETPDNADDQAHDDRQIVDSEEQLVFDRISRNVQP